MRRNHPTPLLAAALIAGAMLCAGPGLAGAVAPAELARFKAWLDSTRAGYGCDEGPAAFRNRTVEAAYPGRRLYYVLTHARGIPPPFANALTLVAQVDTDGRVEPIRSLDGYQAGLIRVRSAKDARLAAAAVMILASCDPGERRWKYEPARFKVRKGHEGWVCTYLHGSVHYASEVSFDRAGILTGITANAPPVP